MSENNEEQKELLTAKLKSTVTDDLPKQQQEESNNKYVVPLGILSVILTLYLAICLLKQTVGLNEHKIIEEIKPPEEMNYVKTDLSFDGNKELLRAEPLLVREKLLEHYNKCYDLEIFTKVIDRPDNKNALENTRLSFINERKMQREKGNGLSDISLRNKKKITYLSTVKNEKNGKLKKRLNGKKAYGLIYSNKSSKSHNVRAKVLQKNEVNQKKGSTAEPIIYVFALVFIYLLLKAASDINQHYKSQSKGDKRLRRCSLQSYAQAHKPDRRASKESPIKAKQFLETRSISVDRYCSGTESKRKIDILMQLRKCTSVDEQQNLMEACYHNIRNKNINVTSGSYRERMDEFRSVIQRRDSMSSLLTSSNRRCSAPVSPDHQPLKLAVAPSLALSATVRRTSISSGSMVTGGSVESVDLQFPEVKKRVRMINRH